MRLHISSRHAYIVHHVPLFGHGKHESGESGQDSPAAPDSDALLVHLSQLTLAQRAAEVLKGISTEIAPGERSAMDRLFNPWLPYSGQYSAEDHPNSWYTLKYLLAETFQALELSRMVFRIDESGGGDLMSYYAISSDGAAALQRGDVAEIVARRLPD